jgi:hypothetical protein
MLSLKRLLRMERQEQKAGDNSINAQIKTLTINQGATISEVRELALDVFKANFFELQGFAKEIARQRAEEITEKYLKELEINYRDGLNQSQDPDFQYALFTVQKEYARCGDSELGDLLVDLLVDRTKQSSRSILQIVLNESLLVAPKLTADQIACLSLIFCCRYTKHNSINSLPSFWTYLDTYIKPFWEIINNKDSCYQHLEYSGTGAINVNEINLETFFFNPMGGFFVMALMILSFWQKH